MRSIRQTVLVVGFVGLIVFLAAFVYSFASPESVEQHAKDIIRYEVEKRVNEKITAIDQSFLAAKAGKFIEKYTDQIRQTQALLSQEAPQRLTAVIAQMQDISCECRKKIEDTFRKGFQAQIINATAAKEYLTVLIRNSYMDTMNQLIREVRIFTGANAAVFAFLVIAVLVKRKAGIHLLPAAVVLLISAVMTAYLYLFNQNWLHTLIFNDFVGLAYLGYLGGVFALLSDIVFNRGRITSDILTSILDAVGSSFEVLPC